MRERTASEPVMLSLREAADIYEVSVSTLRMRARRGELPQLKVRGMWGPEWRVTGESVEALGYRPRAAGPARSPDRTATIRRLERDLRVAHGAAETQRRRADDADRRLGESMMELGRLKTALTAALAGQATGGRCLAPACPLRHRDPAAV